jgi:aryl carrier-like protein
VTGDIYIGGIGLALGYWRDRAKTDAAFIVHPRTGARLYRTGDLGRWRADGNVEFLGRIDHQVKVQGHRIELGEIETTLLQHPAVKEAVVSVAGERHGPKRLIGYVVPDSADAPEPEELQIFLQKTLPDYMVPQSWMTLEQLPLSANGKVDRKALPLPESGGERRASDYVAPRNELERRLADIWRELLQAERIGIHDNFFHAGGDSMLAVKMMMQLRADLGLEVNLAQIFSAPTVARLLPLINPEQK